jgi:fumarate reductase flavoprotein subunit
VTIDPSGLKQSIEKYNLDCKAGADSAFGRPAESLIPIEKSPFYAIELTMTGLYTIGGLIHDDQGRTIDNEGNPILRLYSIGNVGQPTKLLPIGVPGVIALGKLAGKSAASLDNWS